MKKTKSIAISVVLLLICAGGFIYASTSTSKKTTEKIKIGAALGLSGDASDWALATKQGIDLAVEDLAREGINVEIVYEDMASDAKQGVSAVSKLLNVDGVHGIVFTWLDVYQGAEELVRDRDGVIVFSPDAGVEAMIPTKNVFSMWYRTQPKAHMLTEFIISQGHRKLAIIFPLDSFYQSFGDFAEETCRAHSFDCEVYYFTPGQHEDFRTLIAKVKNNGTDAILFTSYDQGDAISFFKEQQVLFPEAALYGEDVAKDFITNPAIAPYITRMTYLGPNISQEAFTASYKSKYGTDPVFSASQSYDSLMLMVEALQKNPDNPSAYLKNKELDSVTYGKFTFDELNGIETNSKQFKLLLYEDGKITEVK